MKKHNVWYGKTYDSAVIADLYTSRKVGKSEVVVPEPLPDWKPVIRISATVVKRVHAKAAQGQ